MFLCAYGTKKTASVVLTGKICISKLLRHCGRTSSVLKESVIGSNVSFSNFKVGLITSGATHMPLYHQEILRCYCSNPYEHISDTGKSTLF